MLYSLVLIFCCIITAYVTFYIYLYEYAFIKMPQFPHTVYNLSLATERVTNCPQSVAWGSDCPPTPTGSPCFPLCPRLLAGESQSLLLMHSIHRKGCTLAAIAPDAVEPCCSALGLGVGVGTIFSPQSPGFFQQARSRMKTALLGTDFSSGAG